MGARDEYRKVAADLRADLKEGEAHLGWLLGEVERHLGFGQEAPPPAPTAEPEQGEPEVTPKPARRAPKLSD